MVQTKVFGFQNYLEALTGSHSVVDLTFYSVLAKMCVFVFNQQSEDLERLRPKT